MNSEELVLTEEMELELSNGEKDEIYLDAYKKWENKLVKREEFKKEVIINE